MLFQLGPIHIIILFLPALRSLPMKDLSVMQKKLNCCPGHLNQGVQKDVSYYYISQNDSNHLPTVGNVMKSIYSFLLGEQ